MMKVHMKVQLRSDFHLNGGIIRFTAQLLLFNRITADGLNVLGVTNPTYCIVAILLMSVDTKDLPPLLHSGDQYDILY